LAQGQRAQGRLSSTARRTVTWTGEKVIEREGYDFTGVNDMFGLSDNYCSMCLAQSRLGSRGFVTAFLNDSNDALSAYILSLLSDGPLFTADVNLVDKANGVVHLIDDGAASIHLARNPIFRITKISYTESTEKAQRYTEMPKIGSFVEGIASHW